MADEMIAVYLYNPHDHDFIYRREDRSIYAVRLEKGKDNRTIELGKEWKGSLDRHPVIVDNNPAKGPYGLCRYGQQLVDGKGTCPPSFYDAPPLEPDPNYGGHSK